VQINPQITAADRKVAAANALLTQAEAESRDLTADEQRSYDTYMREPRPRRSAPRSTAT